VSAARLASLAYELAATPVDDAQLARELAVPPERVQSLSRGRLRHFAPDGVGPADLGACAARKALTNAGLEPQDVDFIVFATNTPDYTFPGSACLLQAAIGCGTVGCLDVRAVCSGFVVALDLARRYVETGTYGRVLVAAAEVPSHQNRFDGADIELPCMMSDMGAVAVVSSEPKGMEILSTRARVDGAAHPLLWCEFPASRHMVNAGVARGERLTRESIDEGRIYPRADFAGLREAALAHGPAVLEAALKDAGVSRVDALVVAHVDPDTEQQLAAAVAGRAGRTLVSDALYSYSASLPVALARAFERGAIASGETVGLLTAGGSASWSACVLRA